MSININVRQSCRTWLIYMQFRSSLRFSRYTCYTVAFSGSSSLLPLICKHFVSPLTSNFLFVSAAASKCSCLLLALSNPTVINSPCCYFFLVVLQVFFFLFFPPFFRPLIVSSSTLKTGDIQNMYESPKKYLKIRKLRLDENTVQ